MMNEKGQAFSTFQLLISAIVAIAILTILFQVLGLIKPPGIDDPISAASNKLTEAYNSPIAIKTSDAVNLKPGKDNKIIRLAVINAAKGIGLSEDNLCFVEEKDFATIDVDDGASVVNTGGSERKVKFSAICAPGTEIIATVGEYFPDAFPDAQVNCPSGFDTSSTDRLCIIVVRTV